MLDEVKEGVLYMKTHELEKELGISKHTIFYYEKEGIVTPQRDDNGYRIYLEKEKQTLLKIKELRRLGFCLEEIKKIGIVPVVVLDDAKDAEPLAKALCEGGLPCAEVTFRTEAAEESIRIISEKYPEMLVGAGTVLTTEQVDRAVAAGAKFIVSPGFNPKVVKYCIDRDIPVTPGTQTPSEMEQAIEMGLDVVKFFPAEPAGGLKMIKAVAAPYTMLQFMPTGGINLNNVEEYLEYDRILACGGSWMVKGDLVKAGKFDEIQKMTADAAALVKKIRG